MASQQEKCEALKALHEGESAFVIPNPWDAGSAKMLEALGFKALATTSAGFAFSCGKTDGKVTLEEKLAHCKELAEVSDLPVSADFENGFADAPDDVAANVTALIGTGIAGCSVEDFSRDSHSIYDAELAALRIAAARAAIDESELPFQLVARAENLIRGVNNLEDTIARLQAYSAVGADMLYAPGISSLEDLKTVTDAIDKPFNVLGVMIPGASAAELEQAGAVRISLGNTLTWLTIKPLLDASDEMLNHGTFNWLKGMPSGSRIHSLLSS